MELMQLFLKNTHVGFPKRGRHYLDSIHLDEDLFYYFGVLADRCADMMHSCRGFRGIYSFILK